MLAIILLWVLHELLHKFISKRGMSTAAEYRWNKISSYAVLLLGVLLVGRIWFAGFESIGTIIGLASAGIAIALKDPLVNMVGLAYIAWQRPFNVGDRIEIGDVKGDVVDQQMMQFTVMEIGSWVEGDQYTGRMQHIPNGKIFQQPLANYSDDYAYLWDEIHVRLTFESNWQKANEIVQSALDEHCSETSEQAEKALKRASHQFMILSTHSTFEPHVYTRVEEFGIQLDARYIVEYRNRRKVKNELWQNILTKFNAEEDIAFAYPTWRFVKNGHSGPEDMAGMVPPEVQ